MSPKIKKSCHIWRIRPVILGVSEYMACSTTILAILYIDHIDYIDYIVETCRKYGDQGDDQDVHHPQIYNLDKIPWGNCRESAPNMCGPTENQKFSWALNLWCELQEVNHIHHPLLVDNYLTGKDNTTSGVWHPRDMKWERPRPYPGGAPIAQCRLPQDNGTNDTF